MVSTRTQTGTITTKSYAPLTLSLNALSLHSPINNAFSPRTPKPRSLGKIVKPASPRKSTSRIPRTPTGLFTRQTLPPYLKRENATLGGQTIASPQDLNFKLKSPCSPRKPKSPTKGRKAIIKASETTKFKTKDHSESNGFLPSIAIGAEEERGLSRIERAAREIAMWKQILREHEIGMPKLAPAVLERLQETIQNRVSIDETIGENWRAGDANPAQSAINKRLEKLKFELEANDIRAAIIGYQNGSILYSENFTLIYASQIIDTASTHSEIISSRSERLDLYFSRHGSGWLWWEAPLNVHPNSIPSSQGSVSLSLAHLLEKTRGTKSREISF